VKQALPVFHLPIFLVKLPPRPIIQPACAKEIKMKNLVFYLVIGIFIVFLLSGCSGASSSGSAPAAIEAYLQALANKDLNQMINLSCAAWEPQARLEYDSFAAVKVSLQNAQCKDAGQENSMTVVACTGAIVATYGTEDMQIELAERPFLALQEGGEWRMCGNK
jgi:hypothetical protein